MRRVERGIPHMSRAETQIALGSVAKIAPRNLAGHVLIAIDQTADRPTVVSDLDPAQLVAALAGVLAVITADALAVEDES